MNDKLNELTLIRWLSEKYEQDSTYEKAAELHKEYENRRRDRKVMSHECPECGQTCYCNGDIEDMENQDVHNYVHCTHYLKETCDYSQPVDD